MDSAHEPGDSGHITACRCCGTCCRKGGPALHTADRPLVLSGKIPLRHLYTIRRGELARDPIRGAVLPVTSEVIKIKSQTDSSICTFFDRRSERCRIYADRPAECRILECWDTRAIEAMYERDRLTRRDLLETVEGLWGLVADHDARCGYGRLKDIASRVKRDYRKDLVDELGEMIHYDDQLRRLMIEKAVIEPEIIDFLFGRPMFETMAMFGLRLRREKGKLVVTARRPAA